MTEKTQEAVIKPEYIIDNLLEQNNVLVKEKAYSAAINKQLQEESKSFLNLAAHLEQERDQLLADKAELVERLEKLEKKLSNQAGPIKRNKKETVEAEIVEVE